MSTPNTTPTAAARPTSAAETDKPLRFIGLHEPSTGRLSSLSIYGRQSGDALTIVGGLSHNAQVVPASIADANDLIAWLTDWKSTQTGEPK